MQRKTGFLLALAAALALVAGCAQPEEAQEEDTGDAMNETGDGGAGTGDGGAGGGNDEDNITSLPSPMTEPAPEN